MSEEKEELVQLNAEIPISLARQVRVEAAENDTTVRNVVESALSLYFEEQDKSARKRRLSSGVEPQAATDAASYALGEQTLKASGQKPSIAETIGRTSGRAKPSRKRRDGPQKPPIPVP